MAIEDLGRIDIVKDKSSFMPQDVRSVGVPTSETGGAGMFGGQGVVSNGLNDLLQRIALANQIQSEANAPRTVNIGGMNILDKTPRNRVLEGITNTTRMMQLAEQQRRTKDFQKSVHDIMSSGSMSQEGMANKMQALMKLKTMHGTDYGLGVDDIVKQFDNMYKAQSGVEKEVVKATSRKEMSPTLENAKNKRLEQIISTIDDNNVKRESLNTAVESARRISGGLYGKLSRGFAKNLSPDDPALRDWQNIKIVLTDAQLMNTAKTKGAISDKEMELFAQAAANDDVASVQRMMPVFDRILKTLNADEMAKIKTYKQLYNEDPLSMEGVKSNLEDIKPDLSTIGVQEKSSNKASKRKIGRFIIEE